MNQWYHSKRTEWLWVMRSMHGNREHYRISTSKWASNISSSSNRSSNSSTRSSSNSSRCYSSRSRSSRNSISTLKLSRTCLLRRNPVYINWPSRSTNNSSHLNNTSHTLCRRCQVSLRWNLNKLLSSWRRDPCLLWILQSFNRHHLL